jgi:predicted RNA-binding Zn-ribbon protein involved in translation (DUF1610 family)
MRAERGGKKKLIVAFHFQFANRAGWDCDACRKHGLEKKRRCGFIPVEERGELRLVWARKRAQAYECPKSSVTGDSLSLVEEFFVRRRLGMADGMTTPARKVDAFLILREEIEREERDVTSSSQH